MKSIIIINDQSPESEHAAVFALVLAQRLGVNLILANLPALKLTTEEYGWTETLQEVRDAVAVDSKLMKNLLKRKLLHPGFKPLIQELSFSCENGDLYRLAGENEILMVIKGLDEFLPHALLNVNLAINNLLHKIHVPLLIVPSSWSENELKRLVYLTDLRFCGLGTVKFLANLATCWDANLVIAHSSASGLPLMETSQAEEVFNQEVSLNVGYNKLFLNILDQGESMDTLEVVVSEMKADLLVLVDQHFHFNFLTQQYFKDKCSLYNPVPILIFPS
ncbi:adenine nucleotide alpha hydrolase family protein [Pedobacter alluvionis]|uniref:Universal stress protein n=1 Tax=Pedobacter alluvionis TaxID=475253 RepID=A0A497XSX3_9SPHI|nr:hypothetical protein [Pedobacter alluvionis]RLJ72540.1 hypothetical protein BCL90_4162 [Pedobacter alluvionis]TFB28142.1 hypothetical protein E3V97_24275 [Pedobacter alluvionis]